jgi:flagellar basal body rod protein FlgG
MSLYDAMVTGLGGMSAGADLVGNAGVSLGNMFSQNLQATRANITHTTGGGHHSGMRMGSGTQHNSAGLEDDFGKSMCEADPASDLMQMMQGKEMYDANAQVVNATDQMVGTLLNTVNGP